MIVASSGTTSGHFLRTMREGVPPSGEALLTADEIIGLDLHKCKLVTLSACETGLGAQESGQGILGLRSAFMAAGARSVLFSLWSVDDEATAFFMKRFYGYLWSHKSESESLRLAQADVRNNKDRDWAHPRFWAAWTLAGEAW